MASLFRENIRIALNSIRAQMLRALLTMLIIAFGIMALVGILTAIEAVKASINSNFTSMGANTFTVRNREMNVRVGRGGKRPKRYKHISFEEAKRFKTEYDFPATASISTMASSQATLKYESKKSNPNIQVFGGDENYIVTSGYELDKGRNFSIQEIRYGSHVVLLGSSLVNKFFGNKIDPINKVISIGAGKYKVIGTLKEKGSSMGFGGDKVCIIPVENARVYFSRPNMMFTINVLVSSDQQMDIAINEAIGRLRIIRKVPLGEANNFEIVKADSLAGILIDNMKKVTYGATAIGFITLLGAAIGLMNIMLVSVTERTREIGIRKAIGASSITIRNQFLMEAIVICQLGGLMGIILGMLIGNVISYFMNIGFIVPWIWIGMGVALCLIVGLISGLYPAVKASRLDPIEALRFE